MPDSECWILNSECLLADERDAPDSSTADPTPTAYRPLAQGFSFPMETPYIDGARNLYTRKNTMARPSTRSRKGFSQIDIQRMFVKSDLPASLRWLNIAMLIFILPAPLLIFVAISLSEDPNGRNDALQVLLSALIYPFLLIGLVKLSFRFYRTDKNWSYGIPMVTLVALLGVVGWLIFR